MGTDCQRIAFGFASLELLAVHIAVEVQVDLVAVFDSAVCDVSLTHLALLLVFKTDLDILRGDLTVLCSNLNALVLAEFDFRLNRYVSGEDKGLALLDLNDRDLRSGHDVKSALIICFRILSGNQLVCCVFIEHGRAVHLLNDHARHFALAEARDRDALLLFLIGALECLFEFVCGNLDRQRRHAVFFVFNFYAHLLNFLLAS